MSDELKFDKENFCRLVGMTYYDGCLFALDSVNQDVSEDTDEWLKDEAKEYAERRYKDATEFG